MARPVVKAVLGPTNTGKTHLALERLCAHSSGIIGLPLRLLAREVYDRICREKAVSEVALITGEERIAPPGARWFVCTTESMPVDKETAFVAVDEAQLADDRDRGHVFTDRVLRARGREETLILGSDALRPVLRQALPEAEICGRPRFSTLSFAGSKKLSRLPRRSAIVAFTIEEVYATAELVRRMHGGAAVVMGALSPRTRNAQVAMFQAGEVDYIVATDAIGMGLNLDLSHIAFASLSKFDGQRRRRLTIGEMAQIAGRAGRHQRDGTFGTVSGMHAGSEFEPEEIERIEQHDMPVISRFAWRNAELDFASPEALIASLEMRPSQPFLRAAAPALDLAVFRKLSEAWEAPPHEHWAVARLWEICGLPDFMQAGTERHAALVARLHAWLGRPDGRIPDDVLLAELSRLESPQGDIAALTAKLAATRVWSYAAQRADWVSRPAHWAARAQAIEQGLSDALHDRLTQRFVDRRTTMLARSIGRAAAPINVAIAGDGGVAVDGHAIGHLHGFAFTVEPSARHAERRQLLAAAESFLAAELQARIDALCEAPDRDITLVTAFGERVGLAWRGTRIATLMPGTRGAGARARLDRHKGGVEIRHAEKAEARLDRWLFEAAHKRLKALDQLAAMASDLSVESQLRAIFAAVVAAGGHVDRAPLEPGISQLSARQRGRLRHAGLITGSLDLFHPMLLKPEAVRIRLALQAAARGTPMPPLPMPGLTILDHPSEALADAARQAGFRGFGTQWVRIDIVERVARALHDQRRGQADFEPDIAFATSLGIGGDTLERILRALGFRRSAENRERLVWKGRRWTGRPDRQANRDNPSFAALRAWKGRPTR